jgi:hypothetical protein
VAGIERTSAEGRGDTSGPSGGCDGSGVTELRVHGISGAPAEVILDQPLVIRVAGDDQAGFYRPRPCCGGATGAAGATLEAYRWGNLTTGTAARTVSFLLLLPFMLSNLAVWTGPAEFHAAGRIHALCRVLGGTVTALFVLSVVGASVDLVGWQCAGYPACTAGREYLSWLAPIPLGARLALLSAVPITAIWLVHRLSARSVRVDDRLSSDAGPGAGRGGLHAPDLWDRERRLALRPVHVAIALGVLDAALLPSFFPGDGAPLGVALIALCAVLLLACLSVLCAPVPVADRTVRRRVKAVRAIRAAAMALTVVVLGYAAVSQTRHPAAKQLPGFGPLVTGLFVTQTVLLVTLAAAVLTARPRRRGDSTIVSALGPLLLSSAAVGLGAAFSAALVYRVADVLDRGSFPSPSRPVPAETPPLQPPIPYRWAALGAVAAVLVATMIGLTWKRIYRRRRRRQADEIVRQDFPHPPPESGPRLQLVRDVVARSEAPDHLGPLLLSYLILSLLSLTAAGLELADLGPTELERRLGGRDGTSLLRATSYLTDVGTYVIGLFAIGLVVVGVLGYRAPLLRRLVGVLWDLGTFWPRVAHPFAPPCYAERAVPELARRIHQLVGRCGPVLLSAHSHGSVLAAAAILRLPPTTLARVGLLTYGSPLRRLYAQLMPAYFGEDALLDLGDRVGWRWRNLWRHTDPIGGPIFSSRRAGPGEHPAGPDQVDRRLRDPLGLTIGPMDTAPPPIRRHWPYHDDPGFAAAAVEVVDQLRAT